eukprot:89308-Pyramimonas_sp.AAC.1
MVGVAGTIAHYPTEARLWQTLQDKEATYRAAAAGSNSMGIKKTNTMNGYERVWTDCGDDMSSIDLEVS